MERKLICEACNMMFHSAGLLEKHKALFCVGNDAGNLRAQRHNSEAVLRNDASGNIHPKQKRTPDLVQIRGRQRATVGWRSADAKLESSKRENDADGAALQNLADEFHKLRTSIEENLMNAWKGPSDAEARGRQLGHSERLQQMRDMATQHERHMALTRARHQRLEQRRDELAREASVLSEQERAAPLEKLLTELREQEERNEDTLRRLCQHLSALPVRQVSIPADQPEPHQDVKMHHETYELITAADGPISTQIKALRRAYVTSGGSNPDIVAQMIDLQAEAQSLEMSQPAASATKAKQSKRAKPPQSSPSWELLAVEQENHRLEEEILRIQIARDRHCTYGATARTELELIQREKQIFGLQAEIERSEEALRRSRRHPPPPRPEALQSHTCTQAPLSLLHTGSTSSRSAIRVMDTLESMGPRPYDPTAGFVVFFDLVTGVDSVQKVLRLVAALYSEDHGGLPTVTPTVQCQLGEPFPHSLGNYALLSVKQPVPSSIAPSPFLCLVVEVQVAKDVDVGDQEGHQEWATCGWTRLELFDQHNQLRSGSWKVPVRSLPIRPSLSLPQFNLIPQVGNMELYVRLVSGRDEDAQMLIKPNPTCRGHYKYPAVVSSLSSHGNGALLQTDHLSSLLPITHRQHFPPTNEDS